MNRTNEFIFYLFYLKINITGEEMERNKSASLLKRDTRKENIKKYSSFIVLVFLLYLILYFNIY